MRWEGKEDLAKNSFTLVFPYELSHPKQKQKKATERRGLLCEIIAVEDY